MHIRSLFAVATLVTRAGVVSCASPNTAPEAQGETSSKIIGGSPATDYPEAVVLQSPTAGCTGAMIAKRVVLTAGHCILRGGKGWIVRAPYAQGQTASSVDAVTIYDDGGNSKYVNMSSHDLALVFLDRDILVPYPVLTREAFPSGSSLVNVGASNAGKSLRDPYKSDPILASNAPGFNFWFTADLNSDRLEPGDSGGPTFVSGTHILVGVNSGGDVGSTEAIARTDIDIDWLYDQMEARGLAPSARPVPPGQACPGGGCKMDVLNTNESLGPDEAVVSSDLKTEVVAQSDGNFVLYYNRVALWSSRTSGGINNLVIQGDGNLVVYNNTGATWASNTFGADFHLQVQADCNVVVYGPDGHPWWATNTAGCVNRVFMP
jgi:hypothetical protein